MTNFFLNRRGESGSVPFRSGRFYSVGTEWYFAVRRGADQGPYDNKDQAKDALVTKRLLILLAQQGVFQAPICWFFPQPDFH